MAATSKWDYLDDYYLHQRQRQQLVLLCSVTRTSMLSRGAPDNVFLYRLMKRTSGKAARVSLVYIARCALYKPTLYIVPSSSCIQAQDAA